MHSLLARAEDMGLAGPGRGVIAKWKIGNHYWLATRVNMLAAPLARLQLSIGSALAQ